MIKVRHPEFDFKEVFPHWAPHIEFAQKWNAVSITPVYVEPYLIRALRKARSLIDPADTELLNELDLFIAQESEHTKKHVVFNRCFHSADYPNLARDEAQLKADLADFAENHSLRFNLAYAEGFESSFGVVSARIWFEDFDKYRVGAKQEALDLWDWHLAEEYEHRELCYKVYMALYAKGFWNSVIYGYFYRLWGVFFALKHLGGYVFRLMDHLMECDRARMTPAEVKASKARMREMNNRHVLLLCVRMLPVLSPFYDPKKKRAPRGIEKVFAMAEARAAAGRTVTP